MRKLLHAVYLDFAINRLMYCLSLFVATAVASGMRGLAIVSLNQCEQVFELQ